MPSEKETLPIKRYDSRLCMFSYYQIHLTSINKTAGGLSSEDGVTAQVSETTCYKLSEYSNRILSVFWCQVALQSTSQDTTPWNHIFGVSPYFHTGHTRNLIYHGMSSNLPSQQLFRGSPRDPWNFWGGCKHHWYFRGANAFGFTTSFAVVDTEQLNTQIHFDTDSSFFVCNNSTTGHICNDIRKLQTNKSLTTANGTGSCFQEETVEI